MSDPAAPAPADVEAIAAVMCHEYHPMHWDVAYGNRTKPCQACKIHAAALLTSPALATLRAHERANALRDAADECHKEARWQTELQMRHTGTPSASQHYLAARQLSRVEGILRGRADRQEPQ